MKELSIEEKAEVYDENYKTYIELINRLEDVKNAIKKQNYGIAMDILCKPYPEFQIIASTELKESEDARIRKVLIDYFNRYKEQEECGIKTFFGIPTDNILAWLEKQGEQKLYVNDNAKEMFIKALERVEEQNNKGYKLTDCDKNSWWEDFKAYTSCIIEQNPADKIEPKFHEGDWTVSNLDRKARQISEVHFDEYNSYYVVNGKSVNLEEYDRLHRLWTIQDAKDGDVLSWDDSKCITIFKNIYDEDSFNSYGFVGHCTGKFESRLSYHDIEGAHPATKEQRDQLEKAMTDAGYTFDFEKKELKKIEQKPAWSEEDEAMWAEISDLLWEGYKQSGSKFSWDDIRNWVNPKLKSLRPQTTWKPSDEQIKALEDSIEFLGCTKKVREDLKSLYEQLKKLKV